VNAYLLVHVRPGPRGTIGLTPVVFPDLAVGPAPPDRARNRLRRSAAERLASLDAIDRLWFIERPKGSLHRVPVDVGKGDNALPITLGIVVVRTAARGRDVAVAYAPAVPNLEVKDRDGDVERLLKKAAARFTRRMSSWSSAPVLAADEPDDTYLEVVELELPGLELEEHDDPAGILAEAGVELTRGEFGRLDRRDALVERVLETLAAEGRSSVLLVGRADVGKTALIHEAARRLHAGEAPSALIGRRMWRVSANELIAGAKYTGMWQERAQRLIAEARESRAIVVMGDPVGIVDAGRWSESSNNLSRFLRPYIESGEVTLVCECTIE
jgi:hypothetical protein